MKTPWIFLALVAGMINPALAGDDDIDPRTIRAWVEQGRILPMDTILSSPALQGRILDVEVEWEDGHLVYEVKVLREDGHRRKIYLDAETGALVHMDRRSREQRRDDDHPRRRDPNDRDQRRNNDH